MKRILLAGGLAALSALALAEINFGVTLSATGPTASLGIPEKNTIALLPASSGGQKINYIVLDDASDTTTAVRNTRKLIGENKVDVVIGSSTTPTFAAYAWDAGLLLANAIPQALKTCRSRHSRVPQSLA